MSFAVGTQTPLGMGPSEIAQASYESFVPYLAAASSAILDDWTFVGCSTTTMTATGPLVADWFLPIVGSATADGLLCNSALLVRKNTAAGGRKNRGRMFVPPFDLQEEVVNTAGFVSATEIPQYQLQYNDFFAEMVTLGLEPTLFHSHPDDAPTPLTGFTVTALVGTQRRRMR